MGHLLTLMEMTARADAPRLDAGQALKRWATWAVVMEAIAAVPASALRLRKIKGR